MYVRPTENSAISHSVSVTHRHWLQHIGWILADWAVLRLAELLVTTVP